MQPILQGACVCIFSARPFPLRGWVPSEKGQGLWLSNHDYYFLKAYASIIRLKFFVVPSNICLASHIHSSQFPRSYIRTMQPILQGACVCIFSARPFPLRGWVPSEKGQGLWLSNHDYYFLKAYASIIRLNTPILCWHNRHIAPYNKKVNFFLRNAS